MADLDDFFAKKDKKKGKAKKFTSSELAKKLEDNSKKVESLKKEQRTATSQPAEIGEEIVIVEQKKTHDEDEWKVFEEKKIDYSGLKLSQLKITEEQKNATNMGNEAVPEEVERDNTGDNPWQQQGEQSAAVPEKKAPVPVQVAPIQISGKYVSPAMRDGALAPMGSRMKPKGAPDLKSQEFFPSLGTEKAPEIVKRKDGFTEVMHGQGGKYASSDSNAPQSINVGNRFSSLQDDS